MTVLTAEYVAGFFDGEGCVAVLLPRSGSRAKPRIKINITQKNRQILEDIHSLLGVGYVGTQGSRNCHQLHIASLEDLKNFIDFILPFARLKRYELVCARVWATDVKRRETAVQNLLVYQAAIRNKPLRTHRIPRR
jgi:intein-encoded DNA endonuclease-like protein